MRPSPGTLSPHETETARWFAAEVQPHEPALRGYLRGSFPAVRDVDDVVQESYLRMWRARAAQPIASARSFLFQVARRLALDTVRRERISPVAHVPNLAALPVAADGPGTADLACTHGSCVPNQMKCATGGIMMEPSRYA